MHVHQYGEIRQVITQADGMGVVGAGRVHLAPLLGPRVRGVVPEHAGRIADVLHLQVLHGQLHGLPKLDVATLAQAGRYYLAVQYSGYVFVVGGVRGVRVPVQDLLQTVERNEHQTHEVAVAVLEQGALWQLD